MDPSRLLRSSITVEHRVADGPPDEMGDPTDEVTTTTFLGYVWQTTVNEETSNTEVATEEWGLALERRAAGLIDSGDTVVAEGITFEVHGPPWPARNPRTQLVEYVQAKLVRST